MMLKPPLRTRKKNSQKQKVFVAWVYLLTEKYETRKVTKNLASEYIKEALKDETDFTKYSGEERWYFPVLSNSKARV